MKADIQKTNSHNGKGLVVLRQHRARFILYFGILLFFVEGCGGGSEDFSKPPAAIANKKPVETEPTKPNVPVAKAASPEAVPGSPSTSSPATHEEAQPKASSESKGPGDSVAAAKSSTTEPTQSPAATDTKTPPGSTANNDTKASPATAAPEKTSPAESSGEGATGLFGLAAAGDSGMTKKPDTGAAAPGTVDPLIRPALAADVAQSGDLLFVESPGGKVAAYETNTRKLLGTWTSVEPDILQIVFDDTTQKVAAVLPSGRVQVWQYRSVEGLDRYSRDLLWNYPEVSLMDGHPGGTNDLSFSPSRRELATVGDDGVLRLWNTDDESAALSFEEPLTQANSFVCSEANDFIVGIANKELIVWDVANRKIVRRITNLDSPVTSLKLYGPGLRGVVGTADGAVIQLNLLQDETPQRTSVFADAVADATLNAETREVTAVSVSGQIRRWKSDLPQTVRLEDGGTKGPLAISQDLQRIALQTQGSVKVRDASEKEQQPTFEIPISPADTVEHAEFLADGRLAIAGQSGWSIASGATVVASGSSGSEIRCLETYGNQLVFTADEAGRIIRWKVSAGRSSKVELVGKLTAVSESTSAGLIVLATDDGTLAIYDLNKATITERFHVRNETILSIVMPDRERLYVGTSAGRVLRIRREGEPVPVAEHNEAIQDLRLSADENSLFFRTNSGKVGACRLIDDASETTPPILLDDLAESEGVVPVTAMLIQPKGLVVGYQNGQIQQWDPVTNSVIKLLKHDKPIVCLNADAGGVRAEFVDSEGQRFRFTTGQSENVAEAIGTLPVDVRALRSDTSLVLYGSGNTLIASTEFSNEKTFCLQRLICPDEIVAAGLLGESQAYAVSRSGAVRTWMIEVPVLVMPDRKAITALYSLAEDRLIAIEEGKLISVAGETAIPALQNVTDSSRSPDRRTLTFLEGGSHATITDGSSLKVLGKFVAAEGGRRAQSESTGRYLMIQTDDRTLSVRDLKTDSVLHRYRTEADLADVVMLKSDHILGLLADGSVRALRPAPLDAIGKSSDGQRPYCLVPNADAFLCFRGLELSVVGFDGTVQWKCPGPVVDGARVACSRNGDVVGAVTTIDEKSSLVIWNRMTQAESRIDVPREAEHLMFDTSGQKVTALANGECVTWQVSDGRQLTSVKADARTLVSVSEDATVFAARGSGQLQRTVSRRLAEVQAIDRGALSVAWSDSGDVIIVGGTNGLLHFLKRDAKLAEIGTLTVGSPIRQIIYSGRVVIARSDQAFLHCWVLADPESPLGATPSEINQPSQISYMELDSRQEFLMTAHPPSEVAVWYLNLVPGPPRQVITLDGRSSAAVAASILPEQRRLVVVDAAANLSVSSLADIDDLRLSTFKAITQSMDANELSEVPKASEGRERKGNDLLTQQLELQNRVRQAQLEKRSRARLPFSRNPSALLGAEQFLVSMEQAHASQLLNSVSPGTPTDKNSGAFALPAGLTLSLLPSVDASAKDNKELAAAYQKMNDLRFLKPEGSEKQPADGPAPPAQTLNESVRLYVESQTSFVRMLQNTAIETASRGIRGSSKANEVRDILSRRLEQISDRRSIQTISTDFAIPDNFSTLSRPCLRISRDGSTIVSTYPPVTLSDDERIPGRIDVWDLVSGVSLKQFETAIPVRGLILNGTESRILTVPEVVRYELFEPTPSIRLFDAVFEESSERTSLAIAGLARRTASASQGEVLQLVDRETLEPLKLPMPESFDAETTALAFGHEARILAFAVKEQQKNYKLYVCSPDDLSGFESIVPVDQFQARSDSAGGFLALTFSPDDRQLAVLMEDPQKENELLLRILEQKNGRWALKSSTPLKGVLQAHSTSDRRIQMRFTGSKNRIAILTDSACLIGDVVERKSKTSGLWRVPLSSRTDPSALSDDGRWLAQGTSAGQIAIFDLTSSYPDVGVVWPPSGDAAHDGPVAALAFSATLSELSAPVYLSSFGLENRIKVWSLLDLENAVKERHQEYRKTIK